jgi:hypothetical protein
MKRSGRRKPDVRDALGRQAQIPQQRDPSLQRGAQHAALQPLSINGAWVVSVGAAAKYLNISPARLEAMIVHGEVQTVDTNLGRMIRTEELGRLILRRKIEWRPRRR